MKYRVVLTEKADTDVGSVLRWFHDKMATQAGGKWLADLMAKLDTLETNPDRCNLAAESDDVGEPIRELLFGRRRFKYRLLFRTVDRTVQILRVWHCSRGAITRDDL